MSKTCKTCLYSSICYIVGDVDEENNCSYYIEVEDDFIDKELTEYADNVAMKYWEEVKSKIEEEQMGAFESNDDAFFQDGFSLDELGMEDKTKEVVKDGLGGIFDDTPKEEPLEEETSALPEEDTCTPSKEDSDDNFPQEKEDKCDAEEHANEEESYISYKTNCLRDCVIHIMESSKKLEQILKHYGVPEGQGKSIIFGVIDTSIRVLLEDL